jgi:hypothetical protein
MVRLLAVRALTAVLKRAIILSARLKPATWQLCSIFSAAMFVLSVWGIRESQRPHTQSSANTISPPVVGLRKVEGASPHRYALIIGNSNYQDDVVSPISLDVDTIRAVLEQQSFQVSLVTSLSKAHIGFPNIHGRNVAPPTFFYYSGHGVKTDYLADIGFASRFSELPSPVRFFKKAPTIIFQSSPEGGNSFKREVLFWASLAGLLVSPLVGVGMLALGWIGLHRKRVEGTLLRLEIEKRRLEIEQLKIALEKARGQP